MKRVVCLLVGVLVAACGSARSSRPPVVTPDTSVARAACADIYLQELQRTIDPLGEADCLRRIQGGAQDADLRDWVRASDEYAALQARLKEPPAPVLSAVHLDGKALRLADGRAWAWRYASAFTILARSDADQEAFLDWAQRKHFTGVRILTTAVLLADLPPDVGRARLPGVAREARAGAAWARKSSRSPTPSRAACRAPRCASTSPAWPPSSPRRRCR
jgi:hypothetical protein